MSKNLYFLLLSEEGPTKKYKIKSYYLKCVLFILIFLGISSTIGLWSLWSNVTLRQKVKNLKNELNALQKENGGLRLRISELEKEKQELLVYAVDKLKNHSQRLREVVTDLGLSKYIKPSRRKPYKGGLYKPEGGIFVPFQEKGSPEILLHTYEKLLSDIEVYLKVLSKVPIGRPCQGYISSGFGRRKDPFTGKPAFHTGIDIVSYPGTPVRATADGKVIYAGRHPGYGKVVVIRHGFGYSTLYGHLQKIKVRAGQKVRRGEVIGYLGSTGRSTGPHLHYEVRRYGRYLNPSKYLRIQLVKK